MVEGQKPTEQTVLYKAPELTTDPVKADYAPSSTVEKIELGRNVFPDLRPALSLPVTPDWVTVTPAEAVGQR